MSPEQAVREIETISFQMQNDAQASCVAAQRYEAHMTLFRAASQAGDATEMDDLRQKIHSSVDVILDASATLAIGHRKILDLQRKYSMR